VIDIEAALSDLAEHLDHPAGDTVVAAVRGRLTSSASVTDRSHHRTRTLIAIAAVVTVVVAALMTIAPARHAIADWLGIGAVEVRTSRVPVPITNGAHPVPGAPSTGSAPSPLAARQLATARGRVAFAILTPSGAALSAVEVDLRVPGGIVALRYPRFTIVEIATGPTAGPALIKLLDPTVHAEHIDVDGAPGLWISGAHEIAFLGRDGNRDVDTIRRSGPVLLWAQAGVTYRIEGFTHLADALAVARSLR
jgi:hypothetical protein